MTGTTLSLDIDAATAPLLELLTDLDQRATNLGPAWQEVGDYLRDVTDYRFQLHVGPDGQPWDALDPAYQRRKKKNQDRILVLDGYLAESFHHEITNGGLGLDYGTNRIYAATHHFGREDDGIPARPVLGINAEDQAEVLDILQHRLTG